jgi:hypothetical protein
MSSQDPQSSSPFLTREKLCRELNKRGYPISLGYFNLLCLPSRGEGPPIARWFGPRPLYDLEAGVSWAESRCSPSKPRPAKAAG